MNNLYNEFQSELRSKFKDANYLWSRQKEYSCDWIISRIGPGPATGVDVGGTTYTVQRLRARNARITYYDYFPPADPSIGDFIAADMADFALHFEPGSLDFIITRHTLEHSLNPLFQLWQYNRTLKENGALIVIVPQHSKKWVWFYTHFNCLPLENWLMLFKRSGFSIQECNAGSWKPDDPEFIEYRFVLRVQHRGLDLDSDPTEQPVLTPALYSKVMSGDARYFATHDERSLRTNVFPYNPKLFDQIARARGMGIPQHYKSVAGNEPVNPLLCFFESNLGRQYTGNPRYIYEHMLERFPNLTYVWSYHGSAKLPGNPIIVRRGSQEYYRHLALASLIVNNTTFPLWYHRPETFYFQTWHGTPFKRLHWDITVLPPPLRSEPEFYTKSTGWNALLSPNPYSTKRFRSAFRYEGTIVEHGYPINDIYFDAERYAETRARVRMQLGIENQQATVFLYAPTWRDNKPVDGTQWVFHFELILDPERFLQQTGPNSVLLVRAHHMSPPVGGLGSLSGGAIDVSQFDDPVELMCAADVLITDYSSIVFDWYCSRKPVVYYVPDQDQYVNTIRGAYFDLEEKFAGPICKTEAELYCAARNALAQPFHSAFYDEFCSLHDGQAARRTVDYLTEVLGFRISEDGPSNER